jgi:hypothetical protein
MEDPAVDSPSPWVAEPTQRGTYGIISLCLSTLIICVWSTLHLNIPTMGCSTTRRFFLQVFWMFSALLAPELLLCFAMSERLNARILLKKVLKFHSHLEEPGIFRSMWDWICRLVNVSA